MRRYLDIPHASMQPFSRGARVLNISTAARDLVVSWINLGSEQKWFVTFVKNPDELQTVKKKPKNIWNF